MSRIGRKPIPIPSGVDVEIKENSISVKGPLGTLEKPLPSGIIIKKSDSTITVERPNDDKYYKALHGTVRTIVNNMIEGVTKGFSKTLEIIGTGYRAQKQGDRLVINIGYSNPAIFEPDEVHFEVPDPTHVVVKGIDKERVGAVSANIRGCRPVNPYSGKGIRYAGEAVRRKLGKAGKVGAKK
ncbi:MAG TPA: 50S ribosomal protein L6 [bacterium]|jgi:large subunit ribosomal protein L6|nr:50S ribosomal protein L6 [Dictyoglomota bacterium]HHV80991.1 50S ribosomal protein L6 [bacterium]HOK29552.1 50S ribosomal protein L6 [bacterium]HOL54855.1 50S ribosomal protein L6 [bacterium]HOP55590.1 50S ribosomal protein L6 [bacterium]